MENKNYPNPGVAAVLSFLFTGLGQIYNGQITKGIILMSISVVSIMALIIGAVITVNSILNKVLCSPCSLALGVALICISLLVISITGIYNLYNAYNTAKNMNKP